MWGHALWLLTVEASLDDCVLIFGHGHSERLRAAKLRAEALK